MEYEGEIELVPNHEGYRLLVMHLGCATCEDHAYVAYGFASSWQHAAHSHSSTDDEGTRHQGVARLIVDEES